MIDWSRVDELRDEVGAEDFLEVVDIFLEEVDEVVARLDKNPDPSQFEAELHFLKGSALNLGFQAFSDLCGAGELSAAQGNAEAVDIAAVIACYAKSRSEFMGHVDGEMAA